MITIILFCHSHPGVCGIKQYFCVTIFLTTLHGVLHTLDRKPMPGAEPTVRGRGVKF